MPPFPVGFALGVNVTVPPAVATQDFLIQGPQDHGVAGLINLFGIESPGLTACLSIADEVLRHQARIGLSRDHESLIHLAARLNLPATQIWLAQNGPSGTQLSAAARYPVPALPVSKLEQLRADALRALHADIYGLVVAGDPTPFKAFRRRVLLMAPVHHHFELMAWSETKIMLRFWIIAAVCSGIGFTLYQQSIGRWATANAVAYGEWVCSTQPTSGSSAYIAVCMATTAPWMWPLGRQPCSEPGSLNSQAMTTRGCSAAGVVWEYPAITASTGIAATHVKGMTIHSWSGIGVKSRLSMARRT